MAKRDQHADQQMKTIVVMGVTGHGKSSLIKQMQTKASKAMYGEPVVAPPQGNKRGTTKEIENGWECKIGPHKCMVYDTPGIGDKTVKSMSTLANIKNMIDDGHGIDMVIVVQDLTDGNLSDNFTAAQNFIETLDLKRSSKKGEDSWERVVLVGTKKDEEKHPKGFYNPDDLDNSTVGVFFEKALEHYPTFRPQYAKVGKFKNKAGIDTRELERVVMDTPCFRGSGARALQFQDAAFESHMEYLAEILENTMDTKAILMKQYRDMKRQLEWVNQQNRRAAVKLKQARAKMKKNEQRQAWMEARSILEDMTVVELRERAIEEAVKVPGVGWPSLSCCPPFALKENIIDSILAKCYLK